MLSSQIYVTHVGPQRVAHCKSSLITQHWVYNWLPEATARTEKLAITTDATGMKWECKVFAYLLYSDNCSTSALALTVQVRQVMGRIPRFGVRK
jgi:hypothetical protein